MTAPRRVREHILDDGRGGNKKIIMNIRELVNHWPWDEVTVEKGKVNSGAERKEVMRMHIQRVTH